MGGYLRAQLLAIVDRHGTMCLLCARSSGEFLVFLIRFTLNSGSYRAGGVCEKEPKKERKREEAPASVSLE